MKEIIKKCLIIAGGEYAELPGSDNFDFIIACDKGYEYAERMGIKYDLILGDFDSAADKPHTSLPVIELPVVKDDTDTMYAVKYALDRDYNDITVLCAFGGRLDHTIANLQTAIYIAEHNANAHLYGPDNELHTLKDSSIEIKKKDSSYLSVFSLTDSSYGVSIKGTKFDTDNITLNSSFPLGVSNEWIGETAKILVKKGIICIVISKK